MKVIQIRVKILLKEDTNASDIQSKVCSLIDYSFSKRKELLEMHKKNEYKFYCFDFPYPVEADKIYKKGKALNGGAKIMYHLPSIFVLLI